MHMSIETVTEFSLPRVLPLIADYQRFYRASPDLHKNREHFGGIVRNPARGIIFLASDQTTQAAGFATLYFPFSSVRAMAICLMNDLYTAPASRGQGVGRALMNHCRAWALEQGYPELVWNTEQSNSTAQALYDSTGASRTTWFEYRWPAAQKP